MPIPGKGKRVRLYAAKLAMNTVKKDVPVATRKLLTKNLGI
jgi:hypothetical protein